MKNMDLDGLKIGITFLFKKWIVKRPQGQCQILFSIYELDRLVDGIINVVKENKNEWSY